MAKPEPKLSHMPRHIKETIVDDLDTETKLSLREVDREFKEVVGNSRICYEELKLSLSTDKVQVIWWTKGFETVSLVFKPKKNGYVMRKGTRTIKSGEDDFRKAAVAKLFSVFKNPKIAVGRLKFDVSLGTTWSPTYVFSKFLVDRTVVFEEIQRILSTRNFRLNVRDLDIDFPVVDENFMSLVPYLEPGILKLLVHRPVWQRDRGPDHSPIIRLAETEQWRQLERGLLNAISLKVPFEKCLNFKILELNTNRSPDETVKSMLETMLQTPKMKRLCFICYSHDGFDMTGVWEYVDQFEKIPDPWRNQRNICFKNPYESRTRVVISNNGSHLTIEKFYDGYGF